MDFVYASNYQTNGINYPSFWVLLNTGHGWIQDTTISHPIYYNSINKLEYFQTGSGSGWITMDINGDKLPDFAKFNNDGTKYVLIILSPSMTIIDQYILSSIIIKFCKIR